VIAFILGRYFTITVALEARHGFFGVLMKRLVID